MAMPRSIYPRSRATLRAVVLVGAAALALNAQAQLPPPPASPAPVVNYEYYAQGQLKRVIQAQGLAGFDFTTAYTYDALYRRRFITDARSGTTELSYTGRDEPVQVLDPRQLPTQYSRDGFGQVATLTSPDTGAASATFDAAGNLKTRLDSRGVLASHTYDELNRATSVTYTWGSQTPMVHTWRYDETGAGFSYGIGRLTSTTYAGGSTRLAYDPQGRLLSQVQFTTLQNIAPLALQTSYQYDAAGHITSIGYPSGRTLSIGYAAGLPTSLSLATGNGPAQAIVSQIQHDPFGPPRSWLWHLSSGTRLHERVFDTSGRLIRYPLGGLVRDIGYDAADRITAYTHLERDSGAATPAAQAQNQGFGYDELGRLKSVNTASGTTGFDYDSSGNRTRSASSASNTGARDYAIAPDSNRLTDISNPARSFSHDPAGNTLLDWQPGLRATAGYDLSNRLASFTTERQNNSSTSTNSTGFLYNAQGQRVAKLLGTTRKCSGARSCESAVGPANAAIVFVYDQEGHLLGEYKAADGTPLREYIWLGDIPIAIVGTEVPDVPGPEAIFHLHADHLNTPRVATDQAGNERWNWFGQPFGDTTPNTNPKSLGRFTLDLRLPGQYFDQETGLSYNGFRDYDAGVGRYVQSDPIGVAGGINTYTYVEGNPVSLTDPTGECPWCVAAGVGALTDLGVQLLLNGFNLKCVNWKEVAIAGAAASLGIGVAQKLGKVSTVYGGANRPTYRFFRSKGNLRVESHPISRNAPDWASYPHWHPDFVKAWLPIKHWPLVEPLVAIPAAAYNASKDDCECQ